MTKTILTARCAPVAIAAILALSSTPAFAQDAAGSSTAPVNNAPPIMQSPVNPVVAPAPAPVATPSPRFVSTPQVQTVPEPDPVPVETSSTSEPGSTTETTAAPVTSASASRATSTPARSAPANSRIVTTTATPSAPATSTLQYDPATPSQSAQFDDLPPPAVPVTNEIADQQLDTDAGDETSLIGLLAAGLVGLIPIGLAIAAVVWWRRRSRVVKYAPQPTVSPSSARAPEMRRVPSTTPAAPATIAPVEPRAPEFARAELINSTSAQPAHSGHFAPAGVAGVALAERARQETRTHDAPAVVFDEPEVPSDDVRADPAASPATKHHEWGHVAPAPADGWADRSTGTANRESTLEQMVAARPDAANPFTSPKARRRRARLILATRHAA